MNAMAQPAIDSNTWIRTFHPAPGSDKTLVCFPHAGGAATFYFPLSMRLRPHAEVLVLQYPGRHERLAEPPIEDIETLADQVFMVLRPRIHDSLAFFGHSMGAIVAFEVARRMERAIGTSPAVLIASGRRAPSCRRVESTYLRDDAGIIEEMMNLSGTHASVLAEEELVRMILPAIRADYRAIQTYEYKPGLGPDLRCPITALVGDSDPQVTQDEARSWSKHTTAGFDLHVFDGGGHFYLNTRWDEVVARVRDVLHAEA
jgi:surfactin synthase thioesterase subunit